MGMPNIKTVFWVKILFPIALLTIASLMLHRSFKEAQLLGFQTEEVGRILTFYVLDHGRLPLDINELFSEKYFQKDSSGWIRAGSRVKGRFAVFPGSLPKEKLAFKMDQISLNFSGDGNDVIKVLKKSRTAEKWAKKYSMFISELLKGRSLDETVNKLGQMTF